MHRPHLHEQGRPEDRGHTEYGGFNSDADAATAKYGPIAGWCVSRVTDMGKLFFGMYHFNEDISSWDTSRVTNMHAMFWVCTSPLPCAPIMFSPAPLSPAACRLPRPAARHTAMHHACDPRQSGFNHPLSFDTSRVTDMSHMFAVPLLPAPFLPHVCLPPPGPQGAGRWYALLLLPSAG